jgi:putative membrane protein
MAQKTTATVLRYDPPVGQPVLAQDAAAPRYDPPVGQPVAGASSVGRPVASASMSGVPSSAPAAHAADAFVRDFGDGAASLRGVFADEYQEHAPVEYEYGLTVRELIFSALSSDRLFVLFAVLIGAMTQIIGLVDSVSGLFDLGKIAEEVISDALRSYTIVPILGAGLLFFFITACLSVLGTAVSYGGFKARRRGGRIEVERGLLSRQYKGVAVTRVQSVEIRQGFIRRLFGYAELRLLTIDSADAKNAQQNADAMQSLGLIVHPFVKMNKVDEILARLVPEFNGRPLPTEFRRLPRVARRRALIRRAVIPGLIFVVCTGAVTFVLLPFVSYSPFVLPVLIGLWVLVAILFVLQLMGALLWYRHSAYAHNPAMLTIRQGGYGLTTRVIPRHKVQWVSTGQNPLQRLARVSSISAFTAAGVGGTKTMLRDLESEEADRFIDWLRPHRSHDLGQ